MISHWFINQLVASAAGGRERNPGNTVDAGSERDCRRLLEYNFKRNGEVAEWLKALPC